MKKAINGKEFYLLSHDGCETAYFVRHLDDDPLGLHWELKHVLDGKVLEMDDEFFFNVGDVLQHIAELNDEDMDELTLYAELKDDGSIDAKDVRVRYELYVRTLTEDSGFGCGCDIADDDFVIGAEDDIESYTGDLGWVYEHDDRTPEEIYNQNKENRMDTEMTESYFIYGTTVKIHTEEEVWENAYIEEHYLQE